MELPPIMKVGAAMPASNGRCADLYHDVRELRLAMEKEVKEIQARETEIQEYLIANLSKGDDTGAAGLRYRAQVVSKRKPKLGGEDSETGGWGTFTSWVRKNDRFDMLQHRINEKAVADWEAENGRPVPGTEMINIPSLSVTKIG